MFHFKCVSSSRLVISIMSKAITGNEKYSIVSLMFVLNSKIQIPLFRIFDVIFSNYIAVHRYWTYYPALNVIHLQSVSYPTVYILL